MKNRNQDIPSYSCFQGVLSNIILQKLKILHTGTPKIKYGLIFNFILRGRIPIFQALVMTEVISTKLVYFQDFDLHFIYTERQIIFFSFLVENHEAA